MYKDQLLRAACEQLERSQATCKSCHGPVVVFFFAAGTKLLDTLLLTTTRLISPPFQEHGAHSRAEQTKRHVLSQRLPQRFIVLLLIHISQDATLSEAGRGVGEERSGDTSASGGVGPVKTRADECHKCQISH